MSMVLNQPVIRRATARCGGLECVVLAVLAIVVVILALAGFGVFVVHRMKPDWLRIDVKFWRALSFALEVGRSGPADSERPPEQSGELERAKPRELDPGPGSSGPYGSADQSNAAAL
jgi:hypothetical protein